MADTKQRLPRYGGYTDVSQLVAWTSYNLLFTFRDLGKDSAIIVYQMGKVGSTTVAETLKSLHLKMPVYQVHHLTKEGQQIEESKVSGKDKPAFRRTAYWAGRYLQRQLMPDVMNDRRWFIVTLTRDPVARNISGFFHSMKRTHPDLYAALESGENERLFPRLAETFLSDYPHDRPLDWFDDEMKTAFGIDLYERPFPWAKGFDIIEHDNVRLLILRLEDLQAQLQNAFEEWLGLTFDPIEIVSANRASRKSYQHHYNAFKDWLVLPATYLERMYNSKYARHYYADAELANFSRKWQGSVRWDAS